MEIDKLVKLIRIAVLDDLILDLQALKLQVKTTDREELTKLIRRIK